tara:strand:+ start:583 stop:1188 length:606 start_codon:yes stop_codon:yes gene_type:complete
MLLKPKKEGDMPPEQGSIEALDPFDHPIPGQSLTDEPGKWSFEKPPEFVDVDEAVAYVVDKIENSNGGKEELQKHMLAGIPIESIVNTIAFTGFTDGQWNPDVAELIKLPLSAYFMMMAQEENIPAIMFNKDPSEDQGITDEQVLAGMQESNPEAFAHLQQQAAMMPMEEEPMPEGFLAMPPQEELMELEEQPVIEGEGMI